MSVGAGSIKRAAGTKNESTVKAEVEKSVAKKPVAKKPVAQKTATKKATKKSTTKKTVAKKPSTNSEVKIPVSNSTAEVHYGLGNELPIFLM